ncbi:MAG TPA: O-antigen ligase family protein, partial [Methylophilus sp.]
MINTLMLGSLIMMLIGLFYFIVRHQNTAAFMALLGKLHYPHLDYTESVIGANFDRMNTTWVHPNLTGGVMALFVPFTFYYGLYQTGWRKLFALTVTALGMMVLLFSISRGAIVSLVLVLLWLSKMRAPFAARILQVGVVLSITAVLAYPPLQSRLSTMFSAKNASTQVRMDEYKKFPEGIARHPLGIGFKTEPPVDKDLLGISNLWLNYMYKMGFIGMLMFIAVTRVWWKEVRPVANLHQLDKEHGLWIGSLSGILAALLTGFFDHYFSFATVLIALFWMMVAINLDSARRLKAQNSPLLLKKRFFV